MKIAGFLLLIALLIRVTAIRWWQFDGLYGQDSFAYYRQAVAILENLPQGRPPPLDFFWPNGFPALLAAAIVVGGWSAWAAQLAALLCGAMVAPLLFLLAADLLREPEQAGLDNHLAMRMRTAGLWAGLLAAVAGQPLLSSIVIMADMPALMWALLAAWLTVRAVKAGPFPRRAALYFLEAGACLALAMITRWVYALIAPALAAYILLAVVQRRQAWWPPVTAGISSGLILLPSLWLSLHRPAGLWHNWLLGWRPAHFWQRTFENVDGHFSYALPNGLFYAQLAGHPAYIFPLLGLASLWGGWQLGQQRRWDALLLLGGWLLPVYLFLGGIPYQNFRFGLTLYPPLAILTGYGLSDLVARRETGPGRPSLKPWAAQIIIVGSLGGMLLWSYTMLDDFLTAQNHSKLVAHRVEQALPPQATLLTFGLTLTMQHYTQVETLEWFYLEPASLQTLLQTRQPLFVLLDVPNIESQWAGKVPQQNYRWLLARARLAPAGSFPPYTLYRVKPDRQGD